MLQITKRLRRYAERHWNAAEDATVAELQKLYGQKLVKGALTIDDIREINEGTKTAKKKAGAKSGSDTGKKSRREEREGRENPRRKSSGAAAGSVDEDAVTEILRKHGVIGRPGDVNPTQAFTKATRIRVKEAAEQYDTARKDATYPMYRSVGGRQSPHPLAGQRAKCGEQALYHSSDRDKAVALAFVRFQAEKSAGANRGQLPRWLRMTDHDREMMLYAAHNEEWTGVIKDADDSEIVVKRRKLGPDMIKTLLDDSVSGGIEITPVVFDDALILTPVLYGELFPFVDVQTVAKGRRVKGGSMINPEFTSGTAEGTAITPFNTSSFVSAFDTPIYPAVSAIELGQDFEEDSPVDLGGQVVEQFGLKALEWLDRVIAVGNGTNEPLGFFNSPAATLVNSAYGVGGPYTVSDAEGLMFGIGKEYRKEAGAFLAYVGNDYTYRKFRSIKVGPGDERRVFGMDHAAYTLLDTPFKVQNSIADGYAAYLNLRRYRMYRRLGMQVRVETGGRQLALSNTRLIVVRMRYGGQLNKGQAAALMKDGAVA